MAWPFGRDHDHIDLFGRNDLTVMDIEPMGEKKSLPFLELRLDILLIELGLDMVLCENLDEIGFLRCLSGGYRFKAIFKGKLVVFRSCQFGDDDIKAAVPQILGLGMSLASITHDRNLLTLQIFVVCILVIIDLHLWLLSPVFEKKCRAYTP
jgi:hypothetical protein